MYGKSILPGWLSLVRIAIGKPVPAVYAERLVCE
jgi:hypothetical protein